MDLRMSRRPQKRPHKEPERPVIAFLRQHARLLLGLLVLAIFVHDLFGEHGFLAMRRAQKEAQLLQQEIQQLNEDNARLAAEVQALKTDPKLIERIAREEMGLARPGERIFKLPPKPPADKK